MTDNQEKELFHTLAALVKGVNAIQSDVQGVKKTQVEHTRILNEHSQILDNHSQILNEHSQILDNHSQILNEHSRILDKHSQILDNHSQILDNHSQILNRLDAKTDTIAETVMTNDKRLAAVERDVADLREIIH